MSPGRTPDEQAAQDVQDARIADVLEQILDDYALWVIAAGSDLVLPVTPLGVDLWETRVRSRIRRDLPPEDAWRAVVMLLTAQAHHRAADLMYTVRDVDPDDLLDGPWSL